MRQSRRLVILLIASFISLSAAAHSPIIDALRKIYAGYKNGQPFPINEYEAANLAVDLAEAASYVVVFNAIASFVAEDLGVGPGRNLPAGAHFLIRATVEYASWAFVGSLISPGAGRVQEVVGDFYAWLRTKLPWPQSQEHLQLI